jgi:O-antigen ligase
VRWEAITGGRLSVWLLTAGLVLSVATQLRMPGLPVGAGEVLLALWCCLVWFAALLGAPLRVPRHGAPFLWFWSLSFAVLLADLLIWNVVGRRHAYSIHAFAAYAFVCILLLTYVVHDTPGRHAKVLSRFVVASSASLAALFGLGKLLHTLGPIDPWYSARFCGWAENPNQIAFHVAALPFLGVSLVRASSELRHKLVYSGCVVAALVVGVATFSDALLIAWVTAGVSFFALDYWFGHRRRSRGYWGAMLRYLFVPIAAVLLLATFGVQICRSVESEVIAIYDEGSQGSVRMALWRHGIEAMTDSPLIGLGPGAHSGVAAPFSGAEAHNSLIDWGASVGIVGLLAYMLLSGWLLAGLWRSGDAALVAAFVSLFSVSLFHYTFRHPVFWFVLVFLAGRTVRRECTIAARSLPRGSHVWSGRMP